MLPAIIMFTNLFIKVNFPINLNSKLIFMAVKSPLQGVWGQNSWELGAF